MVKWYQSSEFASIRYNILWNKKSFSTIEVSVKLKNQVKIKETQNEFICTSLHRWHNVCFCFGE